jgi:hypothetical protein
MSPSRHFSASPIFRDVGLHPADLAERYLLLRLRREKEFLNRKMRFRKSTMARSLGDRNRKYYTQTENTAK